MKTHSISKRSFLTLSGAALCGLAAPALGRPASSKTRGLRVGTYDSRAIAVAAANSPLGRKTIGTMMADYEKAKAASDETKMKELKLKLQARQRRQHEQAFSTGSVMNFMEAVKERLPGLASEKALHAIVSKYELAFVSSDAEQVDVTSDLIKIFGPDERGLKWANQIQAKAPIRLEDLPDHLD